MQYHQLGRTADRVSAICLGTMTWGEQNGEAQAHEQLDVALEHGVNFIDTAEMYPFPCTGETYGDTERFIGSWLAQRGGRERLLLATKVSGDSDGLEWIRGGPRLTPKQIREAVDGSLQRLQTDYIDLYQIHWPARPANYFGKLGYEPHDDDGTALEVIEETLDALAQLVEDGRIRHVGVSNETPWGTMQYLRLAEEKGLPRVASIQNPYSLLNRSFETGLAEIAHRERVSLLPYSPLGFGVLTGKYAGGARPDGARLTLFPRFGRYTTDRATAAADAYAAIARDHGLTPTQLALAYVRQRPFVASTIIGATSRAQLEEDLATTEVRLDDATLEAIEAIHRDNPNPAP